MCTRELLSLYHRLLVGLLSKHWQCCMPAAVCSEEVGVSYGMQH